MTRRSLNIILFCSLAAPLFSQTGGNNSYEFLTLTHSALVSSLGGVNVSLYDDYLNMPYHNPALLNTTMDKNLALNYVNYFAGINYGYASFSRSFNTTESFAGGLTYLNYGTFTEADAAGTIIGTFNASEYAFSAIYSRVIDTGFTVGINFKPVLSHLENYTSFGVAFDIGAAWHSDDALLMAGLVIKNVGYQITRYAGENREKLPFEIQAGITKRLAHAPFRFSLTLRHLDKYDLTHDYSTGATTSDGTQVKTKTSELAENILRHAILGIELIPAKNFYLSAGYNYQRRRELQVESKVAGVGFSWGFGLKLSNMTIGFGRGRYHLGGAASHFTVVVKFMD